MVGSEVGRLGHCSNHVWLNLLAQVCPTWIGNGSLLVRWVRCCGCEMPARSLGAQTWFAHHIPGDVHNWVCSQGRRSVLASRQAGRQASWQPGRLAGSQAAGQAAHEGLLAVSYVGDRSAHRGLLDTC